MLKTLILSGYKCYLQLPLLIYVSMGKYSTFNYSAALLFLKSNTPWNRAGVGFHTVIWSLKCCRAERVNNEFFWNTRSWFNALVRTQISWQSSLCNEWCEITARALWESCSTLIGLVCGCSHIFAFSFITFMTSPIQFSSRPLENVVLVWVVGSEQRCWDDHVRKVSKQKPLKLVLFLGEGWCCYILIVRLDLQMKM